MLPPASSFSMGFASLRPGWITSAPPPCSTLPECRSRRWPLRQLLRKSTLPVSGSALARLLGLIPAHRFLQPVLQLGLRSKAEFPFRPAHVETPPRLPIRLGGVPANRPGETGHSRDPLRQVANGDLPPAAQV